MAMSALYQKGKTPPCYCKSSPVDHCEPVQIQQTFFCKTFVLSFSSTCLGGGEFSPLAALSEPFLP